MKKTFVLVLVISLLCLMAIGTTLTYFTDTDFDSNTTMVVGKVEIEQHEKNRSGNDISTEELKLYPVTSGLVDGLIPVENNGVDKFVSVENTGSEAAYVRTIFAFEMKNDGNSPVGNEVQLVQVGIVMTDVTFIKDGVSYIIGVRTYADPLAGGATTDPSLKQVYLASAADNTFFDAVGVEYDILILSQAVQAKGFETAGAEAALNAAFGAVDTNTVAEWFQ